VSPQFRHSPPSERWVLKQCYFEPAFQFPLLANVNGGYVFLFNTASHQPAVAVESRSHADDKNILFLSSLFCVLYPYFQEFLTLKVTTQNHGI
jgi:hypothetical protein